MGIKIKTLLITLASGLLLNFANTHLWILLICIALVPLFVIINVSSIKKSIAIGFIFGFGIGIGMFSWMIQGVSHYTGNSSLYGVCVCIISSIFLGLYFSILFWVIRMIWVTKVESYSTLFLNRLCVAAIWAISEFGLAFVLQSFPLHYFRIGFPFVTNLYTIQLTSLGGLVLLSFLTVLINLFIADFFIQKKKIYLGYSFLTLGLMFVSGYIILNNYTPNLVGKSFKVAIVSDNTNPETKWNSENGNTLANNYFQLCKDAAALRPDFIIWPETTIPWTYNFNDDLLREIIKISSSGDPIHVIGINNQDSIREKLYNSIFYIDSQNKVNGIYNKQVLLKGIEEPLGRFLVPFLTQEGFVLSKGESNQPIQTSFGKAGNLICNEVVVENSGVEQVKNGANFFFNLSNDGWFKDNYISDLHFYYARLQAVENRKDICIANNCGVNAIINSDGVIVSEKKETSNTLVSGTIQPNNNLSIFTKYPLFFPLFLTLFVLFYLLTLKFKTIRVDTN